MQKLVDWLLERRAALIVIAVVFAPNLALISSALMGVQWAHRGPAVAFDGANFLVVWTDYRSGSDIYGFQVCPAGSVLEPWLRGTSASRLITWASRRFLGRRWPVAS